MVNVMKNIRLLKQKDLIEAKEMWKKCFPTDSIPFVDWYFDNRFVPENSLGYFEDGVMLSSLQMVPQTISLRNKNIPARMIVGACTLPTAQKRGLMKQLLLESFAQTKIDSLCSILYPFQYQFYQKSNYAVVSDRILCKFSIDDLSAFSVDPYVSIEYQHLDAIMKIESAFLSRFDGITKRAKKWINWRTSETILEGGFAFYSEEGNWWALFSCVEGIATIVEIAYTSIQGLKSALKTIGQNKTISRIICPLPKCDAPYEWLADSRGICVLEPFLMLNCVDPAAFLLGMRTNQNCAITLRIQDDFFTQNDSNLRICAKDKKIIEVSISSDPADVSLSKLDFNRWVSGICSAKQLAFEGVKNAQKLDFLSEQSNYFFDMY